MERRPWRRELKRSYMRAALRRYRRGQRAVSPQFSTLCLTLLTAATVVALCIGVLELKLRPVLEAAAKTQTQNRITAELEQVVSRDLTARGVDYSDFITIQRDAQGRITALSTDMAALNLLRTELLSEVLTFFSEIDVGDIAIPLGSLIDSELLWARGPSIQVHAMQVGAVQAEFRSEFAEAGVNQTHHRVWLEWDIPVTVLLPGSTIEVPVCTQLCVAETVIVGQVPETYLSRAA